MRLLDAFPVTLTVSGQIFSQVRVVTVDDQARAFRMIDGKPHMVAEARLTEPVDGRREIRLLATDAGPWRIVRESGCGCHGDAGTLKRMSLAGLDRVADACRGAVGE